MCWPRLKVMYIPLQSWQIILASKSLFICFHSRLVMLGWLDAHTCIITYKPAGISLQAINGHGWAGWFLLSSHSTKQKVSSAINTGISKSSVSATSTLAGKDTVPTASQPAGLAAEHRLRQTKEGDQPGRHWGMSFWGWDTSCSTRNQETSSGFCLANHPSMDLLAFNLINTIKTSLPYKAGLGVLTVINLHCHGACSGIKCIIEYILT